jgi:microcystin-dependent protein
MGPGATNKLGGKLGASTVVLTTAQLAKHSHAVSDPGHVHGFGAGTAIMINPVSAAGSGGEGQVGDGDITQTAAATTGVTLGETGGGEAHNNIQPSTVCNVWIKT